MFRTDLVDVLNDHECWAFIGSGVSMAAGYSDWDGLVEAILDISSSEVANKARSDGTFRSFLRSARYPEALDRLQSFVGRDLVEKSVRDLYGPYRQPSELAGILADWPFVGYITTNYDDSLRHALQATPDKGWVAIGNTPAEVKKLAGGAGRVVWHLHGHSAMDSARSKLVVTEGDYDEIYLGTNPVVEHLRALLLRNRILFVGFGFRDYEVLRVLKLMSQLSNPAKPLFAMVPSNDAEGRDVDLRRLYDKYSVDAIGYRVTGRSHAQLVDLMSAHGAMMLRRSLSFGAQRRPVPSYDPETTGVLVYNEFVLKQPAISTTVHVLLMKARVLSLLADGQPHAIAELTEELSSRSRLLGSSGGYEPGEAAVTAVVSTLKQDGLAKVVGAAEIQISVAGQELVARQRAAAELAAAAFRASLEQRANEEFGGVPTEPGARVRDAAEAFIKECVDRRALGLAMAQAHTRADLRGYHMVALLRQLPAFMAQLKDDQEGLALTQVVQGVLAEPTTSESQYIGLALQARFGVHVLGYDPDALRARWGDIKETAFVVDSSSMIPFLAIGSPGHRAARRVIARLSELGCLITTTLWLTDEVAEHASYAIGRVDPKTGSITDDTYRSAVGRAGERSNAFIDGFTTEISAGRQSYSFPAYLERCIGKLAAKNRCTIRDVQPRLQSEGIEYREFAQWPGYLLKHLPERDELATKIQAARGATYKKPRQVMAEAEAALIVKFLRDGIFTAEGRTITHAHFMSNSFAVDEALGDPVVMRPDAVLQWVSTMSACSLEELSVLTEGLQWELAERGLEIVPRDRIRIAYEPLLSADRRQLMEVLLKNRALIEARFGKHGLEQMAATTELDAPFVLQAALAETLERLKKELAQERAARLATEKAAKITSAEKAELASLKARQKAKRQKDRKRQRSDRGKSRKQS